VTFLGLPRGGFATFRRAVNGRIRLADTASSAPGGPVRLVAPVCSLLRFPAGRSGRFILPRRTSAFDRQTTPS